MPFPPLPLNSVLLDARSQRYTVPYDCGPGIRPNQGVPGKTITFPYDQSTKSIPIGDCQAGRCTVPYDSGGLRGTHPRPSGMQPEARNDVGEWPTKIAQPAVCRCTNPVDRPVPVCEPAQSRSSLSFDSCCKTPWWQTAEVRQAHEFYNVICRETDPDRAAQLLREFIVHPGTRQALKVGCRDALPKDGSHRSDWDDILQDTWLIVWGRMETERNGHRDEGLPEFAALLQKICHDGSVDVIRCRLRSRSLDITFVDPDILADVAAPPEQEHPREQLGPAIGKIRKLGVMATMTLQRNGFSVEMTAEVLGVSTRTVDRWRQQGLEELREIFADESDRDS